MPSRTDAYPDFSRIRRFSPLGVENPALLSRRQIEQFNNHGYISPLDVFNPEEIAAHRFYFDDLLAKALEAGWSSYEIYGWHTCCAGIYDLVTDDRILDYLEDLLGENLVLRGINYFAKMPGDGKQVSWHQDASYWPLNPSKAVTAWLAIDDVDSQNGAMQIIPSSHRQGQIAFHESEPSEHNVLNQTVRNAEQYGDPPVSIELEAGQMSLHTDWVLHRSEPNRSSRRRCGLAMRFVSADVRAAEGWSQGTIICRGSDPSGHWANQPRKQTRSHRNKETNIPVTLLSG